MNQLLTHTRQFGPAAVANATRNAAHTAANWHRKAISNCAEEYVCQETGYE